MNPNVLKFSQSASALGCSEGLSSSCPKHHYRAVTNVENADDDDALELNSVLPQTNDLSGGNTDL